MFLVCHLSRTTQANEKERERLSPTEPLTRTADIDLAAAKLADVPCETLEAESRSLSLAQTMISGTSRS